MTQPFDHDGHDKSSINQAAEMLEQHYGRFDFDEWRSSWAACVHYVLDTQWSSSKLAKAWPELCETWLTQVDETAQAKREELWELLKPHGASASLVAFLHKLARWWQSQVRQGIDPLENEYGHALQTIQDGNDLEEELPKSEWHREVVRQDRTLANRLACAVFGAHQFPITRGIWRVGCRHDWISWHDDPQETAGFFEHQASRGTVDFAQFAEGLIRVAEDFCGAKPKCGDCPLGPLLGPGGPSEPDESLD